MTSEDPEAALGDFKNVFSLLDYFKYEQRTVATHPPLHLDTNNSCSASLGDLGRVFELLGRPFVKPKTISDSETSRSAHSESPARPSSSSSVDSIAINFEDFVARGKEVRFADDVDGIPLEQFESENEPSSRKRSNSRKPSTKRVLHIRSTLRPSALDFIPRPTLDGSSWLPHPSTPRIQFDRLVIQPKEFLTYTQKMDILVRKLRWLFENEQTLLNTNPGLAVRFFGGNNSPDGIHVFVDCSNIVIGFHDTLKVKRGINLKAYTTSAPMSWRAFALILERGRKVARRILVGSNRAPEDDEPAKLPEYLPEAERCGYELNILDRVAKFKDPALSRRGPRESGYSTTSGLSSGSAGRRKQWTEQGVDEILHMKILESIVDRKTVGSQTPPTIVLATGDAAKAEYSGGFLENVLRALRGGWRVELVSWSKGLSRDYERLLTKWSGSFKIIELVEFSEELLAIYEHLPQSGLC
jgi:hypothetical protein